MSEPQEPVQRKFKSTDPVAKWLTHVLFFMFAVGRFIKIIPAPAFYVIIGLWLAANIAIARWAKRIHERETAEQGFDRKGRPTLGEGASGPDS